MAQQIEFILNGEAVRIDNPDPTLTVLDYLREQAELKGTKEGCREGDCGACTVTQVLTIRGELQVRAINACIQFLPALHGSAIFTVEGIASGAGEMHPVQKAMRDCDASQCGFCTPGFVMSLHAACLKSEPANDARISELLAGNLCRCTGYGPIIAAARSSLDRAQPDEPQLKELARTLEASGSAGMLELEHHCAKRRIKKRYSAPRSLDELSQVIAKSDDPTFLAGGTDVGLFVTKQHRMLGEIIDLNQVAELQRVECSDEGVTLGAVVTYSDARKPLADLVPELDTYFSRIASEQIRNSGTIGGNIANGSPIGDMPPVLIALGAELELLGPEGARRMPLEDFFLDYGKQDRAPNEIVSRIFVPRPASGAHFGAFKISKRFDQDISSVCAGFNCEIAEGTVRNVRLAFGGMAGIPKRAHNAEREIEGKPLSSEMVDAAAKALEQDFSPLNDHRASARYRSLVAANLLRKFLLGLEGEPVLCLDREPVK